MMLFWTCMVFGLASYFTTAFGILYISNNRSSSEYANSLCELATPKLQFTNSGITIRLTPTDLKRYRHNSDGLWIGYSRVGAAFLYRGCTTPSTIGKAPDHGQLREDPGYCYSFCQSSFIGVEGKQCYCLASIPEDIHTDTCTSPCTEPKGTSCGKNDISIAIYEKVPYRQHLQAFGNNSCRAYDPVNRTYFWENCDTEFQYFCTTDINSNNSDHYVVDNNTYGSWLVMNNECLKGGRYPVKEQDDFSPNVFSKENLWAGSFRTYIIVSTNDTSGQEEELTQGHVHYDDGSFHLRFLSPRTDLKGLCFTGDSGDVGTFSIVPFLLGIPAGLIIMGLTIRLTRYACNKSQQKQVENAETTNNANDSNGEPGVPVSNEAFEGEFSIVNEPEQLDTMVDDNTVLEFSNKYADTDYNKDENSTATSKIAGIESKCDSDVFVSNEAYEGDISIVNEPEQVDTMVHDDTMLEFLNKHLVTNDTDDKQEDTNETSSSNSKSSSGSAGNLYPRLENIAGYHYNTGIEINDNTNNHNGTNNSSVTPGDYNGSATETGSSNIDTYGHLDGYYLAPAASR